ncbi:cellulose synthase complex periplasmic endoglucanase BcsZ [Photobacterium chitinilyticum]|uniref:cellulase n=1 Tax=Photobacterium chitinilyticum TaxID=2485123 RepID=A0A444JNR3_9GAMM|nr:cellulose synthase complex periplasmic endoglucanase BcsZ [Photobacterium chitinilyticum]RWX54734.1 cellulase [Photobacterium chitinilyticum]
MKQLVALIICGMLSTQAWGEQCSWSTWEEFKDTYILDDGRVLDGSDPRQITTSEGQSYALFFSLIANDPDTFKLLFNWTQTNLAKGDLTARLPAWLWGENSQGQFTVLDANSASDSDLWIAFTLYEAGRLWNNYYYQSIGYLLASRILREETVELEKGKRLLLPAPTGFVLDDRTYRLNPSYVPIQLIEKMATSFPHQDWASLRKGSEHLIVESMPKGFSPDWVIYSEEGYTRDKKTKGEGSYNAIRTYLWAGMLADDDPFKPRVIEAMQPMVTANTRKGLPPRTVNTRNGSYRGKGSAGFSASMLPLLVASGEGELAKEQYQAVKDSLLSEPDNYYYDNVLALFGGGWFENKYRFERDGSLVTYWDTLCQ